MKRLINIKGKKKPKKYGTIKNIAAVAKVKKDSSGIIASTFKEKEEWFRRELAGNGDVVFRELLIGGNEEMEAVLIYLHGSVDKNILNANIIKPLISFRDSDGDNSGDSSLVKKIMNSCLNVGSIKAVTDKELAKDAVFESKAVLMVNNVDQFIILTAGGVKERQVEQPETEKSLRGTKEGFIEDIWNNVALLRKTLPDPALKVDVTKVGRRTKTSLAVIYLKNLADDRLVNEVKNRIQKIDIDGVIANGYVEAFIEDNPYSPFPQALATEKPDKVVAALLEGRIAIFLDRTPIALLVPTQFVQFFQAPEDYFERTYIGTYIRILRTIAFIVTTSAAPAYIALTSFHPELVPVELLLNLARVRKEVPFPPVVEALTMEFVVESLREAGLRLPTAVATTLGVVGGIILGDAAVRSNLVSPAMIIVITITIICNFIIPNYSMSLVIRHIRLFLIFMAATFGAFGITIGWLIIIIHLCRMESFGLPYFSPLAPTKFKDFKDLFIRVPIWAMKDRPDSVHVKDKKRVADVREKKK